MGGAYAPADSAIQDPPRVRQCLTMTLTVTNISDGPFAPDGIATVFPFTFKAVTPSEVSVVRRSAAGDIIQHGYSVSINGTGPGGSVTFSTPPEIGGDPLYILSDPSFQQQSDFSNQGDWSPKSINEVNDRAAARDLVLKHGIDGLSSEVAAALTSFEALAAQVAGIEGVSISITGSVTATTRTALALIPTTAAPVFLTELGYEGGYIFDTDDLSAEVTADVSHINFIAPSTDVTGLSGAWVRRPPATLTDAAQRLSYGIRTTYRTIRKAREKLNGTNGATALHLDVVGYAASPNSGGAGITGGYGKTEYYVDKPGWDVTVEGTFGWALSSAKANGGGMIYFDPRGQYDLIVTDNVMFRLDDGNDNITIFAPGSNVTVWTTSLSGSVVVKGANVLIYGILFRTLAGAMSGDFAGTGDKDEIGLVSVFPQNTDLLVFANCEFRHASDGACDIASTGFTAASAECNVTFQNCIFWDTDEVQLLGSISDTSTVSDVRKLFVTHYNTIFAYCGQRQPKALGNAFVHMVSCYTLMQPWERDQPSPVTSPGECAGAAVQDGGWLLAEGCLWQATDGVGGYNATNLVPNPTSGETGNINVNGCAAEDGCVFSTNGSISISIPYSIQYIDIPDPGGAREAWVQLRWAQSGARPDAAPPGLFVWTDDTSPYPNGERTLIERGRIGRWCRIDASVEYPPTPSDGDTSSLFTTPRSSTRTVGFTAGNATKTAIGATSLDAVGIDSSYFVAQGNGGSANVKSIMSTGSGDFPDGLHLYIGGSSSATPTLKNASSIAVTGVNATTDAFTVTAHGMTTGDWPIFFTSTGTLPVGVGSKQPFYAIVVDANTVKLAASYDDAIAGTALDLTDTGSGTHTATIGNLNLPDGKDIVLNSSSKVTHLIYDAANVHFNVASRFLNLQSGWTAGTGTANQGAFAAYAGVTRSASYVQSEAQNTDNAAKAASQRVLAIEAALRAIGLIN